MDLARDVADRLDGFYFPLDEERGTARVVLVTDEGSRRELDFALLRGGGLETDLAGRDFTINAMAVDEAQQLIDPLGGEADLTAGEIRATGTSVFQDDPVRLLRAPRLEIELGFRIETGTAEAIRADASLLEQPAAERVRDELSRGLGIPGASTFVRRLDSLGALIHVVPELVALKGIDQSPPHRFDVWHHTLHVLDHVDGVVSTVTGEPLAAGCRALGDVPPAACGDLARRLGQFGAEVRSHLAAEVSDGRDRLLLLRLGTLLHDIGKPRTCSADEEHRIHFYGHETEGARAASRRLKALRFSSQEVAWVRGMVAAHLRPAQLAREDRMTRRAVYRYFRDTGDVGVDTILLSLADHLATWGPNLREARWARRLDVAELLLYHYFERPDQIIRPKLPVDGNDLMRVFGLDPGPEVGRLLDLLREAVAAGEVETRQEVLALARKSVRRSEC